MPRDLFAEAGIKAQPRDLFEEAGIKPDENKRGWMDSFQAKDVARNIEVGLGKGGQAIASVLTGGYAPKVNFDEMFGNKNPNFVDKATQEATQIIPFMELEGPLAASKALSKLSPLARKLLASSASGSLLGAQQNPENAGMAAIEGGAISPMVTSAVHLAGSSNPMVSALMRAVLGGGLGYSAGGTHGAEAGALIGATAPSMIPQLSKRLAEDAVTKGVDLGKAAPKLEAARRLGLSYITPAEATGSPFVGAKQGSFGKTSEGSSALYDRSQDRLNSEKSSIKDLLGTIFNKEQQSPRIKQQYSEAYKQSVPDELINKLKQNEIIKTAMNKINKSSVYKDELKDAPENSVKYLDYVKRALDDMRESSLTSGNKNEARLISNVSKSMLDNIDEISPAYKGARQLAQREIARDAIAKKLNEEEISGTNFYNKILKNDTSFEKTLKSLKQVPEAQQKLKDMRLVFKDLINTPTARTAAALEKTGMTEGRNMVTGFKDFVNKLNGGRYDKAAVELITNPRWDQEFKKIMDKKSSAKRSMNMANLLSKITTAGSVDFLNDNSLGNLSNGP